MVLGNPLIASFVIAGHPSHECLRITAFNIREKLIPGRTPQSCCLATVMAYHNVAIVNAEFESIREPRHSSIIAGASANTCRFLLRKRDALRDTDTPECGRLWTEVGSTSDIDGTHEIFQS